MRELYFNKNGQKLINDAALVISKKKNNILTKEIKNFWLSDEWMTLAYLCGRYNFKI